MAQEGLDVLPRRLKGVSPYLQLATGAILLIVGIWATVAAWTRAEQDNATARALDRANSAARLFEEYALRTLRAADNLTRMAVVSLAHNAPDETIRRAVQTGIVDGELFQSLGIQDAQGNLIGSTISPFPPMNYADRDYFQQAMAAPPDTLVVGTPVVSRLTGELAIPVVRRFNAPDGSVGGLVIVQVRADAFERGYRDLNLQGMDYVALIGLDGIARVGSIGGVSVHGRDFSTSNVFLRQKEAPVGLFSAEANTDGILRHVAYRTLEDYPLFAAFGVDSEAAQIEFRKQRTEYIFLGALATSLVLAFTGGLAFSFRQKDRVNAQLRAREDTLEVLATHDYLTGVPNRAALEAFAEDMLQAARTSGTQVGCIFIDLDNFGEVNAALGHPTGDQVLKLVAASLRPVAEEWGKMARVGGDEFVVIFRSDGDAFALQMAERLQTTIETVPAADGVRMTVKASMGVSIFPKDATTFAELVRRADEALAAAKKGRRGFPVFFSADMSRLAEKRLAIRNGLAEAIANDELDVFYQPQVELATGRTIGVEALLRWRHPVLGFISPGDFIAIAEESGLIVSIGAWVIARACRDCAELMHDGHGRLPVAVNVSTLQFRQPDLVSVVHDALSTAGLPPAMLELELTESLIADDPDATVARLEALRALGVSLAMDDFGTGYSNLQYLRRFPLHVLKIDRSFVAGLPKDRHCCSIVLAILALAKALELRVVAEGVETAEQAAFLRDVGCWVGQGYLYGRPMPLNELKR